MYNGLNKTYRSLNGESLNDEDPLAKLRALVEDIVSVLKTGYTVSELEYIEQLLEEIRKLLREKNSGNSDISDEDINQQIKAIEKALLQLEKRLNGEAVIEVGDDESTLSDAGSATASGMDFESKLDAIQQRIDDMKNGKYNQPTDLTSNEDDEEKKEEDKQW